MRARRCGHELLGEEAGEADTPSFALVAASRQRLRREPGLGQARSAEREPEQAQVLRRAGERRVLVRRQPVEGEAG